MGNYWPIIGIFFVWFVFSYPYVAKGRIPFPTRYIVSFFNPWTNYFGMPVKNNAIPDVVTQLYPWKKLTIDSLKNGSLPLWNPYQFAGTPHVANVQSAAFTPFNVLFFVLPFVDSWSLLVLLQPLLAGLFMYLYLRILSVSKESGFIGSVSFMFSGFMVVWMAYGTLGYALLYLPLLLYGIERLYKYRDKISLLIVAVSPFLSIVSGHFQTSLYVVTVSLIYLFVRNAFYKNPTALKKGLLSISISILLSTIQILPAYYFYQHAPRSSSYVNSESIPWTQAIRAVAPDFFGNPVTRNDWVGHYAEWGIYAGFIPFLLSLLVLNVRKIGVVKFFSFLFLVSIVLCFNTPLVQLLAYSKIPVISTSSPTRIVSLIGFSIAVLAAFGFDFLKTQWKTHKISRSVSIPFLFAVIGIGSIWIMLLHGSVFSYGIDAEKLTIAKRNFFMPTLLFVVASVSFLGGYLKGNYIRQLCIGIVLLLVCFEMLRFATKWLPFEEKEYLYPSVAPISFLVDHAKENRVYGTFGNEVFGVFNLYGIEGYDPLYNRRYGELVSSVEDGTVKELGRSSVVFPKNGLYAQKMLNLMGVKYIVHSIGDGRNGWAYPFWKYPDTYKEPVFDDGTYQIYENAASYPRAFLVHDFTVIADGAKILSALFSDGTDLRNQVILEKDPPGAGPMPEQCQRSSSDLVSIDSYTPNEVTISVTATCPGILFLSDSYYPGWNAYVDTKKTEVLRANYTFRAVSVPEGTHTVRFSYENWYL